MVGIYDSFFSLALWVFAHHYYKSAISIKMLFEKLNPTNREQTFSKAKFWVLAIANSILPISIVCSQYVYKPLNDTVDSEDFQRSYLRVLLLSVTCTFQLISCATLTLGIVIIQQLISKEVGSIIQTKNVIVLVGCMYLIVVSEIFYLIDLSINMKNEDFLFDLAVMIPRILINLITMMMLCWVLHQIY